MVPRGFENALITDDFAGRRSWWAAVPTCAIDVRSIRSAASLLITDKGRLQFSQDSIGRGIDVGWIRERFLVEFWRPEVAGGRKLVIDGDLIWNRDTIFNMAVQVNGDVQFATNQPKSLAAASLTVFGDNSLWTGGDIAGFGSAIFNRGTMRMDTNADFPPANIAAFVNSAGATLIHEAPSDPNDHKIMYAAFTNHGVVEVRSGKLEVGPGSRVTHSGTFLVAADADLVVSGQHVFNAASRIETQPSSNLTFSGGGGTSISGDFDVAGPVHIIDGGDPTFMHDVTISKLVHVGTSITGPGKVTVSDEFRWTRGSVSATVISQGTATIGDEVTGQGLSIGGGATLINQGDATWVAGSLTFGNGALRNDGNFTVTTDTNVGVVPFTGGSLDNRGTWTVAQSSGGVDAGRTGRPVLQLGRCLSDRLEPAVLPILQ